MNLDFSNVQEFDPTRGGAIEPGVYPIVIDDVDEKYNGGKSTQFEVTTQAGGTGAAGQKTTFYIGNEPGPKGGNTRKWKTALMAVATGAMGKSEDEARAMFSKALSFDPVKSFKGKKAFIIVTENPGTYTDGSGQEKKNGPDREFITKGMFEAALAAAKANGGAVPAKTNGATKSETPAAAGGAPAAGGDVMDDIFGTAK